MASIISRTEEGILVQVLIPLKGSMLDMEEEIQNKVNEVGNVATQEALGKFDATGHIMQMGSVRLSSKGTVAKEYETPYGTVSLERHVYQSSEGGATFCPLDDRARIVIHSTPKFAKMISHKYTHASAKDVADDLESNHGRRVARGFIQKSADYIGSIAQASEEDWSYEIPSQTDLVTTISASLDGTCVLMKQEGYREAMTGNVSLYNAEGERLHTIYVGAAPEYGKATFLERLKREIDRVKVLYPEAKVVGIADGAKSNWTFLEEHTTHHILDFYHATEYLADCASAFATTTPQRKAWLAEACHRLKHEEQGAQHLLEEMQRKEAGIAANKKISKVIKADLHKAITYFTHQQARMDYKTYREQYLPIGSGVTEAACKTLIKQRMCRSAMQWKAQGAKIIIALRSLVQTPGRWGQFWEKLDCNGWGEFVTG